MLSAIRPAGGTAHTFQHLPVQHDENAVSGSGPSGKGAPASSQSKGLGGGKTLGPLSTGGAVLPTSTRKALGNITNARPLSAAPALEGKSQGGVVKPQLQQHQQQASSKEAPTARRALGDLTNSTSNRTPSSALRPSASTNLKPSAAPRVQPLQTVNGNVRPTSTRVSAVSAAVSSIGNGGKLRQLELPSIAGGGGGAGLAPLLLPSAQPRSLRSSTQARAEKLAELYEPEKMAGKGWKQLEAEREAQQEADINQRVAAGIKALRRPIPMIQERKRLSDTESDDDGPVFEPENQLLHRTLLPTLQFSQVRDTPWSSLEADSGHQSLDDERPSMHHDPASLLPVISSSFGMLSDSDWF